MNHQYRLVWNNINACWQAVAETARGKGKTKSIKTNAVKHNNSMENMVGVVMVA